jgi:aerotaxis receptor
MSLTDTIDVEIPYEGGTLVSETDLTGKITYCNRRFAEMAGYERSALIGRSHNFLRHPDMPKAVFKEMWQTIEFGEAWKGYIKNRRKDGTHYWAVVFISPTHDDTGNKKGYIAVREVPGPQTLEEIKTRYARMRDAE